MSSLDARVGARLVRVARGAIAADLGVSAGPTDLEPWPVLDRRGVFVTLRSGGRLRGCIGTFLPDDDLPRLVRRIAVSAARDPRFAETPLGAAEMSDLRIELSVLSPLRRIEDPLDFKLGVHGIHVTQGSDTGCFLPKVATENGWDKETFLSICCEQKAGLATSAWRAAETEVRVFSVEVFGED